MTPRSALQSVNKHVSRSFATLSRCSEAAQLVARQTGRKEERGNLRQAIMAHGGPLDKNSGGAGGGIEPGGLVSSSRDVFIRHDVGIVKPVPFFLSGVIAPHAEI